MRIAHLSTFHPYRGGIAQFNARLFRELEKSHMVLPYNFSRQYPDMLFPGKTQLVEAGDTADAVHAPRVLDSINPLTWIRTADIIAEQCPDLLLMRYWMSFFGPSLGSVAGRLRRKGVKVLTICDNVVPHEARFFDKAFTRYFLQRNDGFIAMSGQVKEDLIQFRPDARVLLMPHPLYDHFGAPLSMDEARRKLTIAPDKKVLLFFGFIRDYKGLDLLIDAIALLPPDHVLVIAGEPYGDMAKYHAAIERLGLRSRIVDHIRYIADPEVPMFFGAADAVVLPYKSATQSGITAIAQHFCTPIIATDVGGLKEGVADGITGIVVPVPEAGALAEGVLRFFAGDVPSMRLNMEAQRERLSWKRFADQLVVFAASL